MKLEEVKKLLKIVLPGGYRGVIDAAKNLHELTLIAHASQGTSPSDKPETVTVKLVDSGLNKIGVIKAVRELTALGLKEAKDLVDLTTPAYPQVVLANITHSVGETARRKLEEVGATVWVS